MLKEEGSHATGSNHNANTFNVQDNYLSSKLIKLAVKDVIKWTNDNGILAIPCQNSTKKPFFEISKDSVDKITVFHIPTETRVNIVKNIWNNIDEVIESKGNINIAIDTNSGWNNGKNFSFIDIDDKTYISYFKNHFPTCPIIYSANGCKFLFFLENKPKTNAYNLIDEDNNHIGEFYSSGTNRLCLIYGKHPNTLKNPDKPIFYELDLTNYVIPTFGNEFTEHFNKCLIEGKIILNKIKENADIKTKIHPERTLSNKHKPNARSLTEFVGITLSSIISLSSISTDGETVKGAPFHSSKSGTCFQADLRKDSWTCFQCGSGGGPLEYLAVEWGIVDCGDCKGNIFKRGSTAERKLIGKLIKNGDITEQEWVDYKMAHSGGK